MRVRTSLGVYLLTAVGVGCGARDRAAGPADSADASTPLAAQPADAPVVAAPRNVGFVSRAAGQFVAFHGGPRLATTVDARGAHMAPADARGQWSLHLHATSLGRTGAMQQLGDEAPRRGNGRVEIARAPAVTEWFVATDRGVEEGLDVAMPPAGDGALLVEVATDGLTPVVSRGGRSIELRTPNGGAVLTFAELSVTDADGRTVPASMAVESGVIELRVNDAGARYPLHIDPMVWAQQAELVASDAVVGNYFGSAVALDGSTALVAGKMASNLAGGTQGAAYVFTKSGTTWTQQTRLFGTESLLFTNFGSSVALEGATAVVGADSIGDTSIAGLAFVFVQSGAVWTPQATLISADSAPGDEFGFSIALSGPLAVVGAPHQKVGTKLQQGAAYVFANSGTTWTQQAKLVASDGQAYDAFGSSVALTGTTAIVGAYWKAVGANKQQGGAYVFTQSGTTWTQQAALVAPDGVASDRFGQSVALRGSTALVGASHSDGDHGSAYVFTQSGTTWTQQAKLLAADGAQRDLFGTAVALGPNTLLIGAAGCNAYQGAIYVYGPSGASWVQQAKLFAADGAPNDAFGAFLASSGTNLLVGASLRSAGQGAAYVLGSGSANGDACSNATDCASGICVDSVCCDKPCAGCAACSRASTGQPDGTCAAVTDGLDPHAACAAAGATCTAGSLSNQVCNGSAACRKNTTSCAPFTCTADGKGCASSCASDGECAGTQYCDSTHVCATKSMRAALCTGDHQCVSGFCVDGVCCDSRCDGQCQACAEPGSVGTCGPVSNKPRAPRADCAGAGTPCYGRCGGTNIAACDYPTGGTTCGAGCSDGKRQVCDGTGACLAPAPCSGNFACDGTTTCKSNCASDDDCASGFTCAAGKCAPKGAATCSADGSQSIPGGDAGPVQTCAPYRCTSGGTCGTQCTTTDDCIAGSTCDTSVPPGKCLPPAAAQASGGCATGAPSGSDLCAPFAVAAAAVGLLMARRRRSLRR
jgi:hypothetical protein